MRHSEFLSWSKDDRDKAIWQHARERARCRGCGTRPDEWTPGEGGGPYAYRAIRERCRGCEVLAGERDAHRDDIAGKGVSVRLEKRW